VVEAVN